MNQGANIVPLSMAEDLAEFDCGDASLNDWLSQRASRAELERTARTYVLHMDGRVIGYASLAAASIERAWLPGRARRNTPDPIPAIILARLAVVTDLQRTGIGRRLVADILRRCLVASGVIGAKLVIVQALGPAAVDFYSNVGFIPCPGKQRLSFRLLADIEKSLS